ncbi:Pre-ATP-grasp domain-containing protein [Phakopsora pachyrhizi]|nr:Pre-ATP-grasp domain-containing protein [Phakopsora pachyrhizi]
MVIRINLAGDYTRCGRWFKKDVGGAIGLGIFRSDYLLHCLNPDSNITEGRKGINGIGLEIKQVEFNMVSVSFAAPATKVSGLHRFLTGLTSKYTVDQLPRPPNCATRNLCKGREISHWAYRSTYSPEMPTAILMIFQPGERNVFDQTLLIYELDEMSLGPSDWNQMIRLPCDRILDQTRLDEDSIRLYYLIDGADRFEVSVIYYRSMYGPEEFMTEDHWLARYRIERSQLVKCPSLLAQLAGCKKFQQVLMDQNFTLMGAEAVWPINWGQTIRALLAMFSNLRLSLNENLAGVTFLGFGNGAPDVFSTFVAMRSGTGSLAIGELIGAASFIVLIRDYSPGI